MSSAAPSKAMFSLLTTNRSVSMSANLNSSSRHREIPPVKLGLTSVGPTCPGKPDKVEEPAGRAAPMAWSTNDTRMCMCVGGMHTHRHRRVPTYFYRFYTSPVSVTHWRGDKPASSEKWSSLNLSSLSSDCWIVWACGLRARTGRSGEGWPLLSQNATSTPWGRSKAWEQISETYKAPKKCAFKHKVWSS